MAQTPSQRILWIDWAKTIGIMIVVFCHVPQYNTLEKQFLCTFQMPLFFFLSGYLHKVPNNWKTGLKKYWETLIIPYILFQFIFYPYWLVQRSQQEGLDITNLKESFLKPFVECIWGIPIDGITWFIFALLLMKIIADLCLRIKYKNLAAGFVCIIAIIFSCSFHLDDKVNVSFTIDSLFDLLPFFFLGYYVKQYKENKQIEASFYVRLKNIIYSLSFMLISLIIIINVPDNYWIQRIAFYVLGIVGTYFIIYFCKAISLSNKIVLTISRGTIILLGFHWMFIGTTNFVLEKLLYLDEGILYTTFQAVLLVLAITAANYFIILFCEKYFRVLLGGR